MRSATSALRRVLLSPTFQDYVQDNGSGDMMDEDTLTNISIHLKISVTVWDFTLPLTPSLPAVFGVSFKMFLFFSFLKRFLHQAFQCV